MVMSIRPVIPLAVDEKLIIPPICIGGAPCQFVKCHCVPPTLEVPMRNGMLAFDETATEVTWRKSLVVVAATPLAVDPTTVSENDFERWLPMPVTVKVIVEASAVE